jgi:predicted DNA-binding protein (MmcQ/YjbR family)
VDRSDLLAVLRQECLGLPEVRETVKWGHPTFEAGKRMFAVLDHYGDRPCIAFRASPERRERLLADERFFEPPYAARHGWVCLRTEGALDPKELQDLLRTSYRLVALKWMLAALDHPAPSVSPGEKCPPAKRPRGRGSK